MSDNNQVDKMLQSFKTLTEVQAYASAQFKTILDLNKKIKDLNEEVKHLKGILEKSTPLVREDASNLIINPFHLSDEEQICIVQLRKLNEISKDREFTLEESRKFEIFTKSLTAIRNAPKLIKVESSKLTEKELLAAIEEPNESSK